MDRRDAHRAEVIPISAAPSATTPGQQDAEAAQDTPDTPDTADGGETPTRPSGHGRVGVVLVSQSEELASAVGTLAVALGGNADPAPVATTGGRLADGPGASAVLIAAAARRVDQGHGVAVLADLGGAVETVQALLAEADEHGLPFPVRLADAPFVEGAVAAVATATAGGDLTAVLDAAEEMYRQRKIQGSAEG
ncbi:PTS-dependent dihydroxyacetone kinase phosphotransferase subunit DhaM [Kitasatospora sp. McL0602]|uniref:PTS-dependent dihydroxyacetone kinase phosphotransferase subunit DhaM n=1 Tax=Kitasatospora sp. McL0602 TaxID=3439530 RepID=UPI003F8C4171